MINILAVIGTRPQVIKHAALAPLLTQYNLTTINTGQHYHNALDAGQVASFHLHIDKNLAIPAGDMPSALGNMIPALAGVMREYRPDVVLVYGDTVSTLAGALAARTCTIPLVHVEAGLRSGERDMPEEISRTITDTLADLLLAPTTVAVRNLASEGLLERMVLVGDLMYELLEKNLEGLDDSILKEMGLEPRSYILLTVHRAANTDDEKRLFNILSTLNESRLPVICPLHPRTASQLEKAKIVKRGAIIFVDPLLYRQNMALLRSAALCVTDSGGLQKEAYFLGIPCLTLRERTEWEETVEAGANLCVGADPERIKAGLENPPKPRPRGSLVGDPLPSVRIHKAIEQWFDKTTT